MFMTFSTTDFIGGNGFLAIYICAVYLGNQDFIHKKSVLKVFDGLAWLMQIVLIPYSWITCIPVTGCAGYWCWHYHLAVFDIHCPSF
jgi:hypothetical protein